MKLLFVLIVTAACALPGSKYESDLHGDVQAAFYSRAERAYRDILAYDENAPVTKEEIVRLYRRDAYFMPLRRMVDDFCRKLDSLQMKTPEDYAHKCIHEGRLLDNPPEGVIFIRAHLLPFTVAQEKIYDDIQKSGDLQALDALFSPLETWVYACKGAYTPGNGFEAYFKMDGEENIIPCAEGVFFLSDEALKSALCLSQAQPFSPPVRDARGVIVFEFVSD